MKNTGTTLGGLFGILIGGIALFFLNPIVGGVVGAIIGLAIGRQFDKK